MMTEEAGPRDVSNIEISLKKVSWKVSDSMYTFALILFTILWTLLLTFIPVLAPSGNGHLYTKENWYYPGDIIRFIEPIGGLPLNFGIFLLSGVHMDPLYSVRALILFSIGGAVYVQGAAFHSASNMFKHAVEEYVAIYGGNRYTSDILYWMRTVWEHEISHYIYAAGYAIMVALIVFAFRDHEVDGEVPLKEQRNLTGLLLVTSLIYGILISGVAIDWRGIR